MKYSSKIDDSEKPTAKTLRGLTLGIHGIVMIAAFLPLVTFPAAAAATTSSIPQTGTAQTGIASWYGQREAGRRTASGTIFDPGLKTAAHRTLPMGTCVRVTHLGNGRFVTIPVIDRGPYIRGRLIDLSEAAALTLGMRQSGLARVRVDVVDGCPADTQPLPIRKSQNWTIGLKNGERS